MKVRLNKIPSSRIFFRIRMSEMKSRIRIRIELYGFATPLCPIGMVCKLHFVLLLDWLLYVASLLHTEFCGQSQIFSTVFFLLRRDDLLTNLQLKAVDLPDRKAWRLLEIVPD